jgi:hypothetical protein
MSGGSENPTEIHGALFLPDIDYTDRHYLKKLLQIV